jgi:hypothetical protein
MNTKPFISKSHRKTLERRLDHSRHDGVRDL